MSTQTPLSNPWAEDLQAVRRSWGWLVALGVVLILVGLLAIGSPWVPTLATVLFIGGFLVAGGVLQVVAAFSALRSRGFFVHLLAGVLDLVLGFLMLSRPELAAGALTLLLAAMFLGGGLVRIIAALSHRFHNWVWVLLSGVINVVLGIMIWQQWPASSLWVIGLFVGLELLFSGWSCVMLGLAIRGATAGTA
jgi:uncharacterized membrane protein HdeD (DUF308 family)